MRRPADLAIALPPRAALFGKGRESFLPVRRAEDVAQGLDLVLDVAPVIEVVRSHEGLAAKCHDGR